MKRLLFTVPLLIGGVALAAPNKVVLCHNTGSASNPTVTIEVSENAVNAHIKNHGDTLGACRANDIPQPDPTPDIVETQDGLPTTGASLPNVGADGK